MLLGHTGSGTIDGAIGVAINGAIDRVINKVIGGEKLPLRRGILM